jgi:histone deacetylase 11
VVKVVVKQILKIILFGFIIFYLINMINCFQPHIEAIEVQAKDGEPLYGKIAIVYSEAYLVHLGGLEKLHPFDIQKYRHIYNQLVKDNLITPMNIYSPSPIMERDILSIHTPQFLENLKKSMNIALYMEVPQVASFSPESLENGVLLPLRYASAGTLLAGHLALKYGIGINLGGGYHHAKPDAGEGFCIYADIPISIKNLKQQSLITRVLIIDLDVHQGNGTIVCLKEDKQIFTFSMHQGDIYPIPKEKGSLDIELKSGTDDSLYLAILAKQLPIIFEQAQPDIVFLVGGCDTLVDDPLASLAMTQQGIVKRDWLVVEACINRSLPLVITLAGGYSNQAWLAQYKSIKNIIKKVEEIY